MRPPSSVFNVRSPETGTEYRIQVGAPDAKAEPGPWAAMLFLDGDDQFRYAAAAYRGLRAAGRLPPLLLAGVGYGASYRDPGNRRLRDYTPTPMATEPESGGAGAFLRFLVGALWSELEHRYPLRNDLRGLGGHSLGSLLALHALFQPRPFFNRLLASAPSLWWDNRELLCRALQLQREGVGLPARLFFAVGGRDSPSMLGDLEQLEDQLAAHPFPELEVVSRRFPERDHYNVLVPAFSAGLEALFR